MTPEGVLYDREHILSTSSAEEGLSAQDEDGGGSRPGSGEGVRRGGGKRLAELEKFELENKGGFVNYSASAGTSTATGTSDARIASSPTRRDAG